MLSTEQYKLSNTIGSNKNRRGDEELLSPRRFLFLAAAECFAACCGDESGRLGGDRPSHSDRAMKAPKRTGPAVYDLTYHCGWTPKSRVDAEVPPAASEGRRGGSYRSHAAADCGRRIADAYEGTLDERAVQAVHGDQGQLVRQVSRR